MPETPTGSREELRERLAKWVKDEGCDDWEKNDGPCEECLPCMVSRLLSPVEQSPSPIRKNPGSWFCHDCGALCGSAVEWCEGYPADDEDGGDTTHPRVYRPAPQSVPEGLRELSVDVRPLEAAARYLDEGAVLANSDEDAEQLREWANAIRGAGLNLVDALARLASPLSGDVEPEAWLVEYERDGRWVPDGVFATARGAETRTREWAGDLNRIVPLVRASTPLPDSGDSERLDQVRADLTRAGEARENYARRAVRAERALVAIRRLRMDYTSPEVFVRELRDILDAAMRPHESTEDVTFDRCGHTVSLADESPGSREGSCPSCTMASEDSAESTEDDDGE